MPKQTDPQSEQDAVPQGAGDAFGPAEEDLSYEEARDQLVEVVRRLEAGGTSLEESIALWEEGERLARTCQRFLEGARERLDQVIGSSEEV